MACFQLDTATVSHQLVVGAGYPIQILGTGSACVRGSSYIEGPSIFGNPAAFPGMWATVMIGPNVNIDTLPPFIPGALCSGVHNPYSLGVIGSSAFMDTIDAAESINVGRNLIAQGEIISRICSDRPHILSAKKDFDIPHPTKEGWRLTHACVEGPEAAVYTRGRVKNKTQIKLPEYWKKLVDIDSLTISLTPVGKHQDLFIKDWNDEVVNIEEKNNLDIDCFYHIYAERIDTEKLIPEYEGTIEDYPGDNTQRSIVGYHYDVKEQLNG